MLFHAFSIVVVNSISIVKIASEYSLKKLHVNIILFYLPLLFNKKSTPSIPDYRAIAYFEINFDL
jgi:hypothetical protein